METSVDGRLQELCAREIGLLQEAQLVVPEARLTCSEFGNAMARYYIRFETMKVFLGLDPHPRVFDLVG